MSRIADWTQSRLSWLRGRFAPSKNGHAKGNGQTNVGGVSGAPRVADRLKVQPEYREIADVVEQMRKDYQVTFAEIILAANIGAVQVTIAAEGGDARTVALAKKLQELWDNSLSGMHDSTAYGRVAHEKINEFCEDEPGVVPFHYPRKLDPLPFRETRMKLEEDGSFGGIELKTKEGNWELIETPDAWWLAIDATAQQPHGKSRFLPAPYEVWKDKKTAKENRRTATTKWAVRGPVFRGPISDVDEQTGIPYDVLETMSPALETHSKGGALYLPNDRHPTMESEYKYSITQPELKGFDPNALNATLERYDVEMLRAFGIPEQTVIEAGAVGTYGSIAQKMLILFATVEGLASQRVTSFQRYVIDPCVEMNAVPGKILATFVPLTKRPDSFVFEVVKLLLAQPSFIEAILSGGIDLKSILEQAGLPVSDDLLQVTQAVAQRLAAAQGAAAGTVPGQQPQATTGEFGDMGRRQWTNNRKALEEILNDLATGKTNEALARELLGSLGLASDRIDRLIATTIDDGQIDEGELQQAAATMADVLWLGEAINESSDMGNQIAKLTGDRKLVSSMLDDGLHHHFVSEYPEQSAKKTAQYFQGQGYAAEIGEEVGLWTVEAMIDGQEHMFHFLPVMLSLSDKITLTSVAIPRQGFKVPQASQVVNAGLREFDRLYDALVIALSNKATLSTINAIRRRIVELEADMRIAGRVLGMLSPWQPRVNTYAEGAGMDASRLPPGPIMLADKWRWPWISDAIDFLTGKKVVTAEQFAKMADADRRHVFSAPGIDTAKQLRSLQQSLAKSLELGEDLRSFRKRIEGETALTRSQTETMYRTETKRGYVAGFDKAMKSPEVADEFPAVLFTATPDQRVRDTHWDLDGMVCLRSDARMYSVLKRASEDYQCRCSLIALSLAEAEERGIKTYSDLPAEVRAKYG